MDRPIQVGDLVMMVRGHACLLQAIGGMPFTVARIVPPYDGGWHCGKCGMSYAGPNAPAAFALINNSPQYCPIPWLKRIDPLSEPVSIEHRLEEKV